MGIFQNNLMGAAAAAASAGGGGFYDYQISQSARFLGNSYLTKSNFGTDTSTTKKCVSVWVKRSLINNDSSIQTVINGYNSGTNINYSIMFEADGLSYYAQTGGQNGHAKFKNRDVSAWYHVAQIIDTTQGTAANRFKYYVNGVQIAINSTNFTLDGTGLPSQNSAVGYMQNGGVTDIGRYVYNGGNLFTGLIADFIGIDGAGSIDDFGEFKNGVWIPKDPSGLTFGNNGFHLTFSSSSDLGNDSSGNNNDFTAANLATHDQMLDSPTFNSSSNGGNYCTLNPLFPDPTVARITNGNLQWGGSEGGGSVNEMGCMSTFAIPPSDTNIYYFEARMKTGPSGGVEQSVGVNVPTVDLTSDRGGRPTAWCITNSDNQRIYNGANSYTNTGVSGSAGDIVGVEIDRENTTIKFYVNGTLRGTQTNLNTTTDLYPWVGTGGSTSDTLGWDLNFGQNGTFNGLVTAQGESDATGYGNFYYDEAGSCKALCAGNLPVADEIDPAQTDDDYPQKLFTALTYTGDGGGSYTTGFQPDWVWVKRRDGDQSNGLFDSTRGTTKVINSDANGAQVTSSGLTAFNTDGYTMGNFYNQSPNTYVSWSWRINGGTTSTNTNGSVDSTVQVDPSGAFSLVKYRGGLTSFGTETVGHGLSKAPVMIIFKGYDNLGGNDGQWWVGHDALTSWNYLFRFNTDAAESDRSGNGSMASPTSTVFSVNNTDGLGYSTIDNLAYCFTNVEGYCKVGSYVGNADADGTFVYTGFKPKFFMCKPIVAGNWRIQDTARSSFNVANKTLFPNLANAEQSYDADRIDILSNGVKMRASDSNYNQATTFVYLAFAENPFKYATAR
jgi:hypothetical protein